MMGIAALVAGRNAGELMLGTFACGPASPGVSEGCWKGGALALPGSLGVVGMTGGGGAVGETGSTFDEVQPAARATRKPVTTTANETDAMRRGSLFMTP